MGTKHYKNALLSVFIVVLLLTSAALPILGLTSLTSASSSSNTKLEGFDKTAGKWSTGNLDGWKELDWVPYRLKFNNLPEGTSSYTFNVYHNNLLDDKDGVDRLRGFRVGDESGNPVTGSVTVSGPFYKTYGKGDQDIYYTITVRFTTSAPGLTRCLYWQAHLAFGASWWPGSSLHAYADISGKGSVSINVPPTPVGSISGYKWNDENHNGVWDLDENELSGWTIQLYRFEEDAWIYLADMNTDSTGRYSFSLVAGKYRLCEVLKDDWTQTFPSSGYHEIMLSEGETKCNINFGNFLSVVPVPTITTRAATGVTATKATMNADFTVGDYSSVDVWFQYRVQGGSTWIETTPATYTTSGSHSDDVTGLSPNTTYEFRAALQYDTEKIYGGVLTFTTLKVLPTVTTRAATGITATRATMNADFTVGIYDSAVVWFQYRVQGGSTWIETTPATYTTSGSHSDNATGLSPDTTYEFRASLQYDTEKIYGDVLTFTTSKVIPTVTTLAATGVTTTQATMNAVFTVGIYDSVDVWFQYRVQGGSTWIETTPATYTSSGSHLDNATGLTPNTTYEFRGCLQYDTEKIYGCTLTFTTSKIAPTVTTNAATGVTSTRATMNADFTVGGYDNVKIWFQYRVQGVDNWIETSHVTYTASGSHSDNVTSLTPNRTYEFRACLEYDNNKIYGATLTFTTIPVPPLAPTLKSPADGTITNDNTPTFEWTVGAYADNHRLLIDNDPDFTSPIENRLCGPTDNTYTPALGNSLPDENYSWKVIAINALGENQSLVWTFLIDTVPPEAPGWGSPPDGTITDDNTPTFNWENVPDAENYDFVIDNDSDFSSPVIQVTVSVSTYTITVELPDGTYYWRVMARDRAGNVSVWSSTWTIIIRTIVRGTEVSISPGSKSGAPGVTLSYTVTVKNKGTVSDTYTLTATDTAVWGPTLSKSSIALSPQASGTATLTVTIPSTASLGAQDTITVTAKSTTDPAVSASASCTAQAMVQMGVEVSISPDSKSGLPKETLTYDVTVKNTGSIDDTYTLTAEGGVGWSVSIEPTSLILAADATGEATLRVVVPPDAKENDSMTVTVRATSEAYPSVTDSDTCTTVAKGVPVAPGVGLGVLLAILGLLILLLLLLLAYLWRRRRRGAARHRVLRSVWIGLAAPILAVLYLLRGRRKVRQRVFRDASPRPRRWFGDRDC